MSNAETPAENHGGETATPDTAPTGRELAEIPPRIRVHALAKLLGATSKGVLDKLSALGEGARSAQSSVSREVAVKVAGEFGLVADADTPPATTETPAAETPEPAAEPPADPFAASVPSFSGELPPSTTPQPVSAPPTPMFVQPEVAKAKAKAVADKPAAAEQENEQAADKPAADKPAADKPAVAKTETEPAAERTDENEQAAESESESGRRRRRRGRRGRGRGKGESAADGTDNGADGGTDSGDGESSDEAKDNGNGSADADSDGDSASSRRRRRRRRRKSGGEDGSGSDDPPNTVTHVRDTSRSSEDQVRSVRGSTRLEAKRQRRRDGREAGRRRAPILSEAEFLARRESVERTMVVREHAGKGDRTTQIGVLEDGVLVEHFVTSSGSGSIVGNVYLGRVQNVLPSMEAAFVDIGRGRNAVLYAGEVDWDAAGLEGKSRKIEQALSTGDPVLVQVTKDPVGHKGARLTTQISLPGRFLVYVPGGGATGISRKLPENERKRLKEILKRIVPSDAGVIIRTASEGIAEQELERDVNRLKSQWDTIKKKFDTGAAGSKKKNGPTLLYEEPDLLVKVVRDLFTEDFAKLVVQGTVSWETIDSYVQSVAPDLASRLERYTGNGDVFREHRIDEQITKALDRKVWLPSGGYLVIDRTEAMTVIDVNTGKFTGSGGNLEETVTRNNLESAEEIVRQLRLRDIGGIIVIDFIDMVLESNRDLVLRRLTECLSRDRTRHQVAEVTSLGLVQMTRKRVGTGLLEAYSTQCEHCKGRGVVISAEPHAAQAPSDSGKSSGGRKRAKAERATPVVPEPTPEQRETVASAVAAMASAAAKPKQATDENDADEQPAADERTGEPSRAETPASTAEAAESKEPKDKPEVPEPAPRTVRRRRRAASRPAGPPIDAVG